MASKPSLNVLKRRVDFLNLMKTGRRVRPSDWLILNFATNSEGQMRCGWTLPKAVGSAVVRNRLKRWTRIYFRLQLASENSLKLKVDVNLVFRRADHEFYRKLSYDKFSKVLDRGWQQIRRNIE